MQKYLRGEGGKRIAKILQLQTGIFRYVSLLTYQYRKPTAFCQIGVNADVRVHMALMISYQVIDPNK